MKSFNLPLVLGALLLCGFGANGFGQVTPPTNLHDSVPYQGHLLLLDPIQTEFRNETKHRLDCDWPQMMDMIRDLEVKLGEAIEEEVYRDYRDRVQLEDRVFMSYNCYHLRDSIIALQIELDEALASEPKMETRSLLEIAQTVARLRGAVIDDGNVDLQAWAFRYGTDSTLSDSIFVPFGDYSSFLDTSALDTGAFDIELSGLSRYTLYYYSAVGANEEGAGYGDTLSFRTLPDLATGLNLDTLAVTSSSAKLILEIDDAGGQGPDSVGFFWGTSDFASLDLAMDSLPSDSTEGSTHGISLSGLTRYTDYYFNAYADNLAGRSTAASNMAFKTLPELPSFDTIFYNMSADSLVATLSDDGGQAPSGYSMKYDVVANMDTAVSLTPFFANNEIRAYLSDLAPGENYFANASATNDAGTTYSDTGMFVTPPEVSTIVLGLSTWTKLSEDFAGSASELVGLTMDLTADGQTLAVGTPLKNGQLGQVNIYTWTGDGWAAKGDAIVGDDAGEQFGKGLAISDDGKTFVAGAWQYDDDGSDTAGKAKIYEWNEGAGTWELKGGPYVGVGSNDFFGQIVAISGDGSVVAMGAKNHDETGGVWNVGRVQIMKRSSAGWEQMGADLLGDISNAYLGSGIRLSTTGNTIIVGGVGTTLGTSPVRGMVQVLDWNEAASTWELRGSPIEELHANDGTGESVAISGDGNTIFIGSSKCDAIADDQGRVRAFKWNPASLVWEQLGDDLDGERSMQQFGQHISATPNGLTIAVGSPEGIIASGQPAGKGYIRVFDLVAGAWQERSEYIEGDLSEFYGRRFEISGDGQSIAVGRKGGSNEGGIALWNWPIYEDDQYPKPTRLALGGEAVYNSAVPTSLGFFYDTNASFSSPDTVFATLGTEGEFESLVTGLASGKRHFFKAFATNAGGTAVGTLSNLATQLGIETDTASVSYDSMHFEGYADYDDAVPTNLWFVYGFTASLEEVTQVNSQVLEPDFAVSDVAVPAGIQVFYAAQGENESGISGGDTLSVITQVKPIADYVTSPTDSTATLNGHFEYAMDLGAPDSVGFEWSLDPDFEGLGGDSLVSAVELAADTSLAMELPFVYGQTYYYRAIAVNAGGRSEGESMMFCAGACPDSVSYDGVDYGIVRIGCQCLFTENLQTEIYVNGDSIGAFPVDTDQERLVWSDLEYGGTIALTDSARSASGGFYSTRMVNNASVNESRKFCPPGWKVLERSSLVDSWPNYLQLTEADEVDNNPGFSQTERNRALGRAIKASPLDVPGWDGTNAFGFSLLPYGAYQWSGSYGGAERGFLLTQNSGNYGELLVVGAEDAGSQQSFPSSVPSEYTAGAAGNVRCQDDPSQIAPSVFAINAANTTPTSATIRAITGFGGWKTTSKELPILEAGFIWSDNEDLLDSSWVSLAVPSDDSLNLDLTGLVENETYWYAAFAINENDTVFSDTRSFVAALPSVPGVQTKPIHNIETSKFFKVQNVWEGALLSKGNNEIQSAGWKWSLNSDLSESSDTTQIAGYHSEIEDLVLNNDSIWRLNMGNSSFSVIPKDLLPGATYYYAAYATNALGTGWGDTLSVYTPIGVQPGRTVTYDHSVEIDGKIQFEQDAPDTVAVVWSVGNAIEVVEEPTFNYTAEFESSFAENCQIVALFYEDENPFSCLPMDEMDPELVMEIAFFVQEVLDIPAVEFTPATYQGNKLSAPTDTVLLTLHADSTFSGTIQLADSIEVGSTLHYQVYAHNSHGTFYSPVNFFTTGACASIEYGGYTYPTQKFQNACWFTENLRTEVLNNGDSIPYFDIHSSSGRQGWLGAIASSSGAQSFADSLSLAQFGRIYGVYTTHQDSGLCPVGTRIANGDDWNNFSNWLNEARTGSMSSFNASQIVVDYLSSTSIGGTNVSGFNAGGVAYAVSGTASAPSERIARWWRKPSINSQGGLAGPSLAELDAQNGLQPATTVSFTSPGFRDGNYVRCVIEDPLKGPEVQTLQPIEVGRSGATLRGDYDFAGWRDKVSAGFKWGYAADLSDAVEIAGDALEGPFKATLSDLAEDSTIFFSAFAIDELGNQSYGDTLSACLMECPEVAFDGHVYETVVIGCQCWFQENLRSTHYANGDSIRGNLTDAEWGAFNEGAQAIYGGDSAAYYDVHGRLYNRHAVNHPSGICPANWRLPSLGEFNELTSRFGGATSAGEELKSDSLWDGTNLLNLSITPGGRRWVDGAFESIDEKAFMFLSTASGETTSVEFSTGSDAIIAPGTYGKVGYSVRCLRDSATAPVVTTLPPSAQSDSSAVLQGQVEFNWDPMQATGFKWGLDSALVSSQNVNGEETSGLFSASLSNLNLGDTIFYAAYATNGRGTSFGDTLNFVVSSCSSPTFAGYTYEVIEIGGLCIFAENLQSLVYANGDSIPNGLDDAAWSAATAGAVAVLDGDETNAAVYGRLYNQHAVFDSRGVCPAGWSVPANEFADMLSYTGGNMNPSLLMSAEVNTAGWGGTDDFGFDALPSGSRNADGTYTSGKAMFATGVYGPIFSFPGLPSGSAWQNVYEMTASSVMSPMPDFTGNRGVSVRCIKQNVAPPKIRARYEVDAPGSAIRLIGEILPYAQNVDDFGFIVGTDPMLTDGTTHPSDSIHDSAFEISGCENCSEFSGNIPGLTAGVLHYYTVYGTNEAGTSYSDTLSFIPRDCQSPTMDGYTYEVTYFNNSCWFAENLQTTVYGNGDPITINGSLTGASLYSETNWENATAGMMTYPLGTEGPTLASGAFYNGFAVLDSRGVCPSGWEVPTYSELSSMRKKVQSIQPYGSWPYFMQSETEEFNNMNGSALDLFGFSAQAAGVIYANGTMSPMGAEGPIWSQTPFEFGYHENPVLEVMSWQNFAELSGFGGLTSTTSPGLGAAVRCVQSEPVMPEATIHYPKNVAETTATLVGEVLFDGNDATASAGFIWGASGAGSDANSVGATITDGLFSVDLTGLSTDQEYYYIAYVTNVIGTHYSDTLRVTPRSCESPTFNGVTYDVVMIGNQCWFAENLQTDQYLNGDPIPGDLDDSSWSTTTQGAQDLYNNDAAVLDTYGRIYNRYAVLDSRGLCPVGWHIPSTEEFQTLNQYFSERELPLGELAPNSNFVGPYLRQNLSSGWEGNNLSGFSAVGEPKRYYNGSYTVVETGSNFWSSKTHLGNHYYFGINTGNATSELATISETEGMSVRCIAD